MCLCVCVRESVRVCVRGYVCVCVLLNGNTYHRLLGCYCYSNLRVVQTNRLLQPKETRKIRRI